MATKKADNPEAGLLDVSEFAGAKVNLTLRVVGKRSDGYHLLESLVVHALDTGDRLSGHLASLFSLRITGPQRGGLEGEADNLVLQAARLLAPSRGATLVLDKRLPIASGIGGGSSDAAASLRLLNRLWGLGRSNDDLRRMGRSLGADVPMCIEPQPAFVTGIGEVLTPVRLPALHLVLVNPGMAVSTAVVFRRRNGAFSAPLGCPPVLPDTASVGAYMKMAGNDLAAPACAVQPIINDVCAAISATPGCLHAAMSGSGATCFGLFRERREAEAAALAIGRVQPTWWVRATTTRKSLDPEHHDQT